MSNYYYLDVSLEFDNPFGDITVAYFKNHIVKNLYKIFGATASSITVDVLKYDISTRRAILRVPKQIYVKLRASLTLCGSYEDHPCFYKIHKASPLLLALQGDSRNYQF